MNARFNISNGTNALKPSHMPAHARTEDTIRLEQPISSILPRLGSDHAVWFISPEASVFEASEQMTANNVDALVVLSAQKLDGIITIREVDLQGNDARETRVSEIMTKGVYYLRNF